MLYLYMWRAPTQHPSIAKQNIPLRDCGGRELIRGRVCERGQAVSTQDKDEAVLRMILRPLMFRVILKNNAWGLHLFRVWEQDFFKHFNSTVHSSCDYYMNKNP